MAIQDTTLLQSQAALYIAEAQTISLHTDDPGTTGANELTGGSPAYARKTITWVSDGAGLYHSDVMTFDVPSAVLTHIVVWNGSTMVDVAEIDETFSDQTTFDLALIYTQS